MQQQEYERVQLISEYGEILAENLVRTDGSDEIVFNVRNKKNAERFRRHSEQAEGLKLFNESNGGFVFMYYNNLLFKKLNIDLANISRTIYLATFIDYDSNILVSGNGAFSGIKKKPMTKRDIKKILKLSDSTFKRFYKEILENGVIEETEEGIKINDKYFVKGNKVNKSIEYTRVYIDTVRNLFLNCKTSQHKTLAYAFKLIPKLDFNTNIIVDDPAKVEPKRLNLTEVGEYLEISTEKKNLNKFKNKLYQLFIEIDNKKYYVFKRVIIEGKEGRKDYFVVNPRVIYSGNDYDKVMATTNKLFFE